MSPSQHSKGYPRPGQIFTLGQIEKLPLDDIPALDIEINGNKECVQTSHVNEEKMFRNCPELKDSLWRFEETTDEWIPVFTYIGPKEDLSKLFDWEPYIDPYRDKNEKPSLWITPKGSPRQQYY